MGCLKGGTSEQAKLVDCLMFQEMVLQKGFQSETSVQKNKCLVSDMSSSAAGIVVISETGKTKGSPWSNPEW